MLSQKNANWACEKTNALFPIFCIWSIQADFKPHPPNPQKIKKKKERKKETARAKKKKTNPKGRKRIERGNKAFLGCN